MEKLSSEYNSWNEEFDKINGVIKHLDRQSFIIALNLTHFSDMLQSDKEKLIQNISQKLKVEFTLKDTLYTDQDSLVWQSIGLSTDKQSVENASILTQVILKSI